MRVPVSYAETATVITTGDKVRILRRRSIAHDQQIMAALEAADCVVIGMPQNFRYKRPSKPKFTRPALDSVFILDDAGAVTATLPGDYFYKNYRVIK